MARSARRWESALPSAVMPEGHTIARIAPDHGKLLAGRAITVSSPQGRFADASMVDGVVLDKIEPYGKHLHVVEW